jgi:hypothetical protein
MLSHLHQVAVVDHRQYRRRQGGAPQGRRNPRWRRPLFRGCR